MEFYCDTNYHSESRSLTLERWVILGHVEPWTNQQKWSSLINIIIYEISRIFWILFQLIESHKTSTNYIKLILVEFYKAQLT